ncbi:bile acid:sodium symporter, partial [Bacillus sp. LL01]
MIFSKHLPLLIVVVAVFTFFFPYYMDVANWVPSFLLAIVIFFTGLSMKVDAIKSMKSNYYPLLLATVFKWTFTVLISVFLAYAIFSSRPEIAAGVILSGTVPNATAATLYTFIAGGNAS